MPEPAPTEDRAPFRDLTRFEIDLRMVRPLPEAFCRERHVVLLGPFTKSCTPTCRWAC